MPNTLTKRGGPRAVAAAARRPALPDQGIVVGIVAVTGTEDSVQDVIVPGAFADTLTRMRPKLCWMHDWKLPLGRVLSIVELQPGDKRLPKVLPDGRAWPVKAGALLATMQFNLRTQQGREFFEHAKEWAKNGEAAFSIGYKVVPGMASKRADGVRLIYKLDLYEVSLVLHGAHNMALALEVKDAMGGGMPELEHKHTDGLIEYKGQPDFSDHAMIALYPSPETAAAVCHPDGHGPDDMHVTLAYLGKASDVKDPNALATHLATITSQHGMLEGNIGGLGIFPTGDNGTPVFANVDVPRLETLRHNVVTGLDQYGQDYSRSHGYTPHMTLGYDLPSVSPLAPVPVSFDQAVLVVGDQRYPLPLTATSLMEGKAAAAVLEAKALPKTQGKAAHAALLEAKSLPITEGKSMPRIHGSHEERRSLLVDALESLLTPKNEKGDRDTYLCIDATFDDHVICTVTGFGNENGTSYRVTYAVDVDGDAVKLDTPSKVELSVVVEDEAAEQLEGVKGGDAVQLRFIDPASAAMADAARYVMAAPEGKGLDGVSPALLGLLDALAVKGYDVARAAMGMGEDDEDEGMPRPNERYTRERKGATTDAGAGDEPVYDDEDEWSGLLDDPDDAEALDGEEDPMDESGEDPAEEATEAPDEEAVEDAEEPDAAPVNPDAENVTLDPAAVEEQIKQLRA